jgi:hypothetical protein
MRLFIVSNGGINLNNNVNLTQANRSIIETGPSKLPSTRDREREMEGERGRVCNGM